MARRANSSPRVDIRGIRIPVEYADFDDFWVSNTVPIGPQGKLIDGCQQSKKSSFTRDCGTACPSPRMDVLPTFHSQTRSAATCLANTQ